MKKGLVFLFLGFAVICKAGIELDYGLKFTAGASGMEPDKFVASIVHAGLGLDLTEKIKVSINGECTASKWLDAWHNHSFNALAPMLDISIHHKL